MIGVLVRMLAAAKRQGSPTSWIELREVEQHSRDVAMLAYWDLIVQHGMKRGWWKVTILGEEFLRGDARVEKYAHVYNGETYRYSGPLIGVEEVEPGFNYDEVVRGVQSKMEVE